MRGKIKLEEVQKALETLSLYCYGNALCDLCAFLPFCERLRGCDISDSLEDVCRDIGNNIDEILARKIR